MAHQYAQYGVEVRASGYILHIAMQQHTAVGNTRCIKPLLANVQHGG